MKIIRLLIIFGFLATGIKTTIGQSQLLAVENATWIIGEISTINYPVTIHYYTYQIEGDTTVNSIEYKKVYKYRFQEVTHPIDPGMSTPTYPMHIEPNSKELFGLVRDYQQKVYAIRYGEINAYSSLECPKDSEYELFDYTWQVGDTVQLCIQQDMPGKVTSIELNYPHFNRKTYFVGNHRYYEGIGTQKGLFEMIIELVKLWDGTVLYDYCVGSLTGCGYAVDINENERPEDRIKIYPNPAVNFFTIESPVLYGKGYYTISDIFGKLIKKDNLTEGNTKIPIDFDNGVYFIKLYFDNAYSITKKIIINQ